MRTYPEYKDSGVEWIGEIPEGWKITRMVSVGQFSKGKNITKDELRETGYPCIVYSQLYTEYERLVTSVVSFIDDEKFQQTTKVNPGTFLFTSSGETIEEIGKCVLYDGESEISVGGDMVVFKIHDDLIFDTYFLSYVFNSDFFQYQKSANSRGEIVVHVYERQLRDMRFPIPPLTEQKQISDYLDRKTQKIDDLIEKTERKVELLKEQRSSLINQCVTKGLDPNVEMKDSGVEWIGKVPKEWKKIKTSYFCDVRDGTHDTPSYVDEGGVPLVTQKDLVTGNLNFSKTHNISYDDYLNINKRSNVVKNDILMSMIGSLGNPVLVDTDQPFSIKNVCLFKTSLIDQDIKFFLYFLRSEFLETQLVYLSRGGVQGFVSLDVLRNLTLFLPPLPEQKQISDYLNRETSKIDRMVDTETKRIELLKEYRQSLISNVVTGKIDVRDEVVQ